MNTTRFPSSSTPLRLALESLSRPRSRRSPGRSARRARGRRSSSSVAAARRSHSASRSQQRRQRSLARPPRRPSAILSEVARRRSSAASSSSVVLDVEADADHRPALLRARLDQDPGDLALVDPDVVGPLDGAAPRARRARTPRTPRRPWPAAAGRAASPAARTTIESVSARPRGATQARPWRPRPAVCSSASTTVPGGRAAPPRGRARRRSSSRSRRGGRAGRRAGSRRRGRRPQPLHGRSSTSASGAGRERLGGAAAVQRDRDRVGSSPRRRTASPGGASANVRREDRRGGACGRPAPAVPRPRAKPALFASARRSRLSCRFPKRSTASTVRRSPRRARLSGAAARGARRRPAAIGRAGVLDRRPERQPRRDGREQVAPVERGGDRLEPVAGCCEMSTATSTPPQRSIAGHSRPLSGPTNRCPSRQRTRERPARACRPPGSTTARWTPLRHERERVSQRERAGRHVVRRDPVRRGRSRSRRARSARSRRGRRRRTRPRARSRTGR